MTLIARDVTSPLVSNHVNAASAALRLTAATPFTARVVRPAEPIDTVSPPPPPIANIRKTHPIVRGFFRTKPKAFSPRKHRTRTVTHSAVRRKAPKKLSNRSIDYTTGGERFRKSRPFQNQSDGHTVRRPGRSRSPDVAPTPLRRNRFLIYSVIKN